MKQRRMGMWSGGGRLGRWSRVDRGTTTEVLLDTRAQLFNDLFFYHARSVVNIYF